MRKLDKIFVAGHRGMVGSAVIRKLKKLGYLIYINSPHCGGGEGQSTYSLEERNDMCFYMSYLLDKFCIKRGLISSSLNDIVINQLTRRNNLIFFSDEHHLLYPPNKLGINLQRLLIKRLLDDPKRKAKNKKASYEKHHHQIVTVPVVVKTGGVNQTRSTQLVGAPTGGGGDDPYEVLDFQG